MSDHDARTLDLLRLDALHYARLYRDTYHVALAVSARAQALERQLAETRAELRRLTAEACR